jgi:O-antigen/teichoic acid export membrane protein
MVDASPVIGARQLLKDTAVYGLAMAVNRSTWLILFPLYALHYSVTEFGTVELFLAFGNALVAVATIGQDSSLLRFYNEQSCSSGRRQLVGLCILIQFFGAAILLTLGIPYAARQTPQAPNAVALWAIILLQTPLQMIANIALTVLRAKFDALRYFIVSVSGILLQVPANVVAITVYGADIQTLFLVNLAATAIFAALGLWLIRNDVAIPRNFWKIAPLLKYGLPMWGIVVIAAFQPALDRSIAATILGDNELGLYAAGARLAMLISLPLQAFQTAWMPFIMVRYRQPDLAEFFNFVLKVFVILMCSLVVGLEIASTGLVSLLGAGKYSGSEVVVFPIAMGLGLQGIALLTGIGTVLANKTHLRLITFFASLMIAAFFMFVLAARFGIFGLALGFLFGQIAKCALETYFGNRVWPLAMKLGRISGFLSAALMVGFIHALVLAGLSTVPTVFVESFMLCSLALLAWFWVLDQRDRERVASLRTYFPHFS